jgi:MFS family permease
LKIGFSVEKFPEGLNNAFLFAWFNALSFQVVLSSPMVLYAKSLGASATILGVVQSLMPLLVIFQIPAAQYVSRYGYKKFVHAGWNTRVLFIFGMATVPIAYFLDTTTRLALILLLLFGFNLSRGISSAGWLPWITSLVPQAIRGKYLTREQAWMNMGSFICFILAAFCLGRDPGPWQFSLVFVFSAVMGSVSLTFLKRIPETATPEIVNSSNTPVPWREMLRYAPFRKLLRTAIAWSAAYGGMTVFTVAFLKVKIGMPEGTILLVSSVQFLGGLSSLWFFGARLDSHGSKPILTVAFASWGLLTFAWAMLAGSVWSPWLGLILILQFFMGLCAALVSTANTRLAMALVPVMGRNHFFAIFNVCSNMALGLSPILWGLMIDAIGEHTIDCFGVEWNRYSLFFIAVVLVFGVTLSLARTLEEPQAATMEDLLREVLITSPQRAFARLWLRD